MVNIKVFIKTFSILRIFLFLNIVNAQSENNEKVNFTSENDDGFVNVCPVISCETTISDLTCY